MNEQLIVKNFGPIKDATVDFKKVTVFIGPTGGGKSTLAKLAAIFRDDELMHPDPVYVSQRGVKFSGHNLSSYFSESTYFQWDTSSINIKFLNNEYILSITPEHNNELDLRMDKIDKFLTEDKVPNEDKLSRLIKVGELLKEFEDSFKTIVAPIKPTYVPSERIFIASIEYSWAGLMRDDIGLPKNILSFSNHFSLARKNIGELDIPFFGVKYLHIDGRDFVKIPERIEPLLLLETASGIQSVTPLLVLLEDLSRQKEQAQSFIIEEPELNLYPTAQQGLLNWLVDKCTQGENDLTITTHSPYILAHLNLLLYAYQVAEKHPDRADDVAKIVPRESWINPKEFACYHVEGQKENGVHSIVNPETGLISYNGLDSTATAETSEFEKLLDINAGLEVE